MFLDNFGVIADAPNGIANLRALLYSFATSGKLTSQSSKEAPPLIGVMADDLPGNWRRCSLDEIAQYGGSGQVASKDIPEDSWLLDLEDIEKGSSTLVNRVLAKNRSTKSTKSKFNKGDVLYGKLRPYLDKVLVAQEDGFCTTEIVPIAPSEHILAQYLVLSMKSPNFLFYVNDKSYGMKMPRLGTKDALASVHNVPPLAEQMRVVAKVDKLLALCDELESEKANQERTRSAARASAIDAISIASTPEELSTAWSRISNNWDAIADSPESIEGLKLLINDLGITGALNDHLETESTIWPSVSVGEISEVSYGYTESAKTDEVGPKFLRITDIKENGVSWDSVPYCVISQQDEAKHLLQTGDLVFARTGATTGKSYLLDNPPRAVSASYLIRLRPNRARVLPRYLSLYFQTGKYWFQVKEGTSGTAQGGVNSTKLKEMSMSLPPLSDQELIVNKVDQLLVLCDELESHLNRRSEIESSLADALSQLLSV